MKRPEGASEPRYWVGVDEAGRGALAGPIYAAAALHHPDFSLEGLKDSKKLSSLQRTRFEGLLKQQLLAFGVAYASHEEVERLNPLKASLLAMARALEQLPAALLENSFIYIDGPHRPKGYLNSFAVVGGDRSMPLISAASVLAKVARDLVMERAGLEIPGYGFEKHKGYGVFSHLEALKKWGPSKIHRKTYAPVKQYCKGSEASILLKV